MSKRPQYRPAGFTLVELLVVIGILVILMGILFPAVIVIRQRARYFASQAQLSGIANAANDYYMDQKAYPGYFSNADVGDPSMESKWTGTENLVLSLLGQVSIGNGGGTITVSSKSGVTVTIDGIVAANGGGGGGGDGYEDSADATPGDDGYFGTSRAQGGSGTAGSYNDGGDGGRGGAADEPWGDPGEDMRKAGGGGGAAGRIRINTASGNVSGSFTLSPFPATGLTTFGIVDSI